MNPKLSEILDTIDTDQELLDTNILKYKDIDSLESEVSDNG